MPTKPTTPKTEIAFEAACALLESILEGPTRGEILTALSGRPFERLGDGMRSHSFSTGRKEIHLAGIMNPLDRRTRREGFHVLHDWDGKADKLNEEMIPVDVLHYRMKATAAADTERRALAILLDYYFFYLLALLSLRIWDEGDAGNHLDRLSRLLAALQGPDGSGQKFVANVETLIPIATSHFEPDASAYDRLLEKVRTLKESHRTTIALVYAAILASHLRFGFEATYGRDIVAMRKDNAPDYPWLSFALSTLMGAYARMHEEAVGGTEREKIVEGLLNGLSPDPRAFVGAPPDSLSAHEEERSRFAELFRKFRPDLLEEFETHRPSEGSYSPVAFFFNFSHNLVKGLVVDAVLRGEPWRLTLNDLLSGIPRDPALDPSRKTLAKTLMGYARSSPDTIRGRPVPAVVYDPRSGARAFKDTIERLRHD